MLKRLSFNQLCALWAKLVFSCAGRALFQLILMDTCQYQIESVLDDAAVGGDILTGNPARFFTDQKQHNLGDVVGFSDPSERR